MGMHEQLKQLNARLPSLTMSTMKRGIEKENLRVTTSGRLAHTDHPKALGSSLCNPDITTDFAESLIEVITSPYKSLTTAHQALSTITAFVNNALEHDYLWPYSMPCFIDREQDIRIAQYGQSNTGKMKTLYRQGLALRYGKTMQIIAGMHYNISLPKSFLLALSDNQDPQHEQAAINHIYFRAIRQFYQHYWLLAYLFGASPACMTTSLTKKVNFSLKPLDAESVYSPYATSLRLSHLGYHNKHQDQLHVSYADATQYATSLIQATQRKIDEYAAIGVIKNGQYQQLSDALLQISNEYYSPIRPKRVTRTGERPATALLLRGVEYIEIRTLDLNPFLATGIALEDMAFLEVFLAVCATLEESTSTHNAFAESTAKENINRVATRGRDPLLTLRINQQEVPFRDVAKARFDQLFAMAEFMDKSTGKPYYHRAVTHQYEKIKDVSKTPSAMFMAQRLDSGQTTTEFLLSLAQKHQHTLNHQRLTPTQIQRFKQRANASFLAQDCLEKNDPLSFDAYLKHYFSS